MKKLLTCASFLVAVLGAAAAQVSAQEWKAHGVPLFVSASHPSGHQGFVRVINRADQSGEVLIDAVDDEGVPSAVVTLAIDAGETVHFNSGDLEDGNAEKGLSGGIGEGDGDWRLRLRSQLDLEVLAYNRTSDGLLAPLHDLVPGAVVHRPGTGEESMGHRVAVFNPASNVNQVSRLRIINAGEEAAAVTIEGIDDDGETPGTAVELEVPAGASRMVTSEELESGDGDGLAGMLDDGKGKWQLVVTADAPVEVMSLLSSPTGHLTNLSTEPEAGEGDETGEHDVPLFAAADNPHGYQGFVRVINRSGEVGEVVSVEAFDDAGVAYGPVMLDIDAHQTVHFNSGDLEGGNPDKGLMEGIGSDGIGDWRLVLRSDLDLEVLAYNRTDDGLLTTLHDLAPYTEVVRPGGEAVQGHHVAIFNPASNVNQVSRLRIINPGEEPASVTIEGIDDAGASPGTAVELTVPAGASHTLTSQALESGQWASDIDASGGLGDGKGKWRLAVTSERTVRVMSLLSSPTGHLVNLSTAAPAGVPVPPPVVAAHAAIEVTGKTTASAGTPVELSVKRIGASDVAIERYEWVFSDGQRERGEEVSVSFAESGVHDVTVSGVSGTDVVAQATWAVAVFDAAAGANPGFEGIPAIFGDVNRDGQFGRDDLELAEQAVEGAAILEPESLDAADLDLSGGLEERDVELMRQALDAGAALPSALLDESAYPGGVVAMVSPTLRDADADIEVFVDGVPSPHVMRAILGYATFAVPASLTGEDAEVEVVVEANGTVAERLRLLLKPAVTPTVSAKEDVLTFLAELTEVIAEQQQAGVDFIAQTEGLTEDDTAIVLGAAKAAAQQLEAATAEIKALLDAEGGDELATILQAALYANGLGEFRESLPTDLKSARARTSTGSQVSPSVAAVCDKYVPAICALKISNAKVSGGLNAATGLCALAGVGTAVGALVTLNPAVATGLGFVGKACLPVYLGLKMAQLIGQFIESVTLGIRLESDRNMLQGAEEATITAEVTFAGLQRLCEATQASDTAGDVAGSLAMGMTRFLLLKSDHLASVRKILKKASSEEFIEEVFEDGVGRALTLLGLDRAFGAFAKGLCFLVGSGHVTDDRVAFGLTADGSRFNLRASNGAPLKRNGDGSGTYSLSCPAGFSGTLVVKGNKELCGDNEEDMVRVSCKRTCDKRTGTVNIADANLRAAVLEELGKAAGDPITPEELATVRSLTVPHRNIGSLAGLECATGLHGLDARDGRISDLSPLSGLPALKALYLDGNEVSDVSPLSDLPSLTTLHLTGNLITDVSSLSGLPALRDLLISRNPISTLSLSDLPSMTALNVSGVALERGSLTRVSLSDLPALESAGFNYNQISRFSFSGLPGLTGLGLGHNHISDSALSSLSDLTTLKGLNLSDNQISAVSPLTGLTALNRLDLSDNEISNIGPLVANAGLGRGDYLDLLNNPLSKISQCTHIPALGQRGVRINFRTFTRPECD